MNLPPKSLSKKPAFSEKAGFSLRLLITGGSGYLGAALVRHLDHARPQWELHAAAFKNAVPPGRAIPHYFDLTDPAQTEQALARIRPNVIIHTAALNRGNTIQTRSLAENGFVRTHPELYALNVAASEHLAQWAQRNDARLLHLSSDVIFDGRRGNYRETDEPHPLTPYAESKYEAERAVLAAHDNVVCIRTSLIYGFAPLDPRTQAMLDGSMPKLFVDERRCPIWVETLCAALVELVEHPYRGVLNVAGRQKLDRYEFGVKLVAALGGDTARLIATTAAETGLVRPLDCTLDCSLAEELLETRLLGVDEVMRLI